MGKSKCHIIAKGRRFTFQYNPTAIPYSRTAKYTSIESAGMSYPLTQYVGGDVREFTFDVFYYDNDDGYSGGKINRARKFLESLLPPERNVSGFKKPPVFELAYGYFVRKCVMVKLDVEDTWLDSNGQPIMTTFTLTVRQVGR